MNLSYTLAEFVANTKLDDIPLHVKETQKKSIMDAVAIILGANTLGDGCRQMVSISEQLAAGGRGEAAVIGYNMQLPAAWAAFANASMAHALDFSDTHQKSTIHSNASSFPAALAVAESLGDIDGRSFLTALVVGSEVAIRIALAADINTTEYGFYPPSIYSSYGATAAVAKLMKLTPEQIVSAFSFNLCQTMCSSELVNNPRTAVRSVREAFTARNAIVACWMAKEGLVGFDEPLEGRLGFYHTFLRDQFTADRALAGLGEHYEAAELTFKAWPCCFGTHSAITAALQLMHEYKLVSSDILHIQVYIGIANRILFEPLEQRRSPETAIIGKFSIPFTLATAIIKGDVTLDSFNNENLHDPKIRALAGQIDYTCVEEWQRGSEAHTKLVMKTKKGIVEKLITSPFGTPENPMDENAFDQKFKYCAGYARHVKTIEDLELVKNMIRDIDNLQNIKSFAQRL